MLTAGITPYLKALQWQEYLADARRSGRIGDILLLLEHPPVLTTGRQGGLENLLVSERELKGRGIDLVPASRGGNVTFHGPGQLVCYPILNLKEHLEDIHWYVRQLEEVLIRSAAEYGISAERRPGMPGVWVGGDKLASIGVAVKEWVTMHGLALNVENDLEYFSLIRPCGLTNVAMTSISRLAGRPVSVKEAAEKVLRHFAEVFRLTLREVKPEEVLPFEVAGLVKEAGAR